MVQSDLLALSHLALATQGRFLKDGDLQLSLRDKVAVVETCRFANQPVKSSHAERWQAFVFDGLRGLCRNLKLRLQPAKIFALFACDARRLLDRHDLEVGKRNGIDQIQSLPRGLAHGTVQLDLVLADGVFGADRSLLLALQLNLRAQDVQADPHPRVLRGFRMLVDHLILLDQGVCVGKFRLVCKRP